MARIKLLTLRLGLLLLLYTVARALFLVFNVQSYHQENLGGILGAFAIGLRFDVAAICRINLPFIIFSMLPGPVFQKVWYQKLLKILFLICNIPFLIINVVDLEYFKFTGQRSSLSLLDMSSDILDQVGQLSFHYWYLVVIAGVLVFLLHRFFPERVSVAVPNAARSKPRMWVFESLAMAMVVGLAVLGMRGGWQSRPLTAGFGEAGDRPSLSFLALNSSYTLLSSQRKCDAKSLNRVRFFSTDEELKKALPPKNLAGSPVVPRRDNIVIIIVESLSAEYTGIGNSGRGYTPFLDELAKRGLAFRNGFANGRRSIDAPPAILAGLPHLRDETFFCTQFKELHGIGSLLKEQGYDTSFFHGGKNGTMYFDVFSQRMGFDRYYGLNEYPKPEDSDGVWGVPDEPMLQFLAQEMNQRKQPFATVLFTLSMHNPYILPKGYEGVFPKGELPIHEIVGYFDHALKKFFETAEKMPWYKNTLFVITGDHIGPPQSIAPRLIDNFRVPLIFFHPGHSLPKVKPDMLAQHVDIKPTLLDFLGIATDRTLPFGRSIFDPANDGLALGQENGVYWLAHRNYYLEYKIHGPSHLFALANMASPMSGKLEVKEQMERRLKAYIQWFNTGLAENKLYR
jgi:phosphoglycerol transferase MdoB-like AlkP superfamily enzyme